MKCSTIPMRKKVRVYVLGGVWYIKDCYTFFVVSPTEKWSRILLSLNLGCLNHLLNHKKAAAMVSGTSEGGFHERLLLDGPVLKTLERLYEKSNNHAAFVLWEPWWFSSWRSRSTDVTWGRCRLRGSEAPGMWRWSHLRCEPSTNYLHVDPR